MKNRLENSKKAWEKAMSSSRYLGMRIRSDKEIKDYWNKLAPNYDNNVVHSDEKRVIKVLEMLKRENYLKNDSKILDIGSGTGAYTIPMAKMAKTVTAIDSSSNMCCIVKEKASREKINNICIMNDFWENIDLKKSGLYKEFNLVFSSLNPSIVNFETLTKMNDASNRVCCLIYFAGPVYDPVKKDLWKVLFDNMKVNEGGGNDIIYPFSILYDLGYYPKIDYLDVTWTVERTKEMTIENFCNSFWLYTDITSEIRKKIDYYVSGKLENGIFTEVTKAKLGIITWNVN